MTGTVTLLAAASPASVPGAWVAAVSGGSWDPGYILWQSGLIILFIFINGFFVAAEFALVKVRASQLDEIIEAAERRGHRTHRAQLTKHLIANINSYLSACQLGITIASLVLGALGEPFVHRLIEPLLGSAGLGLPAQWVRVVSWTVAISSITALHVVLGEQMPKTLAIRRALDTSLWVARPLRVFALMGKPLIWGLNAASDRLLQLVFRVEPAGEAHLVHSADELRMLVTESEREEEVTETERDILINALELNDLLVRDIMTPRSNIVALDINQSFLTNLRLAVESQHTRFPLIDGHLNASVGLLHMKDLLRIINEPSPDVRAVKRKLPVVPKSMPLDKLLQFFLKEHAHLALVVDEFGGVIGMVTLDDVIEEVVGEIQDEFDTEEKRFQQLSENEFTVEGTCSLYELAERTGLQLESDEVSTIGGYITNALGHLPTAGESVEIDGYEAVTTRADGRRVIQVHFKRLPPAEEGSADGTGAAAGETPNSEPRRPAEAGDAGAKKY